MGSRGMTVEAARQGTNDRKKWKALVHRYLIELHAAIMAWVLCSFGPPSRNPVAYHLEMGGMQLHDAVGVN